MFARRGMCLLAFAAFVVGTLSIQAQQPPADPLRTVSDKAMEKLKALDFPAVLETLQPYGKWTDDQRTDALEDWKKRREKTAEVMGKPVGEIEFIKREFIGKSFVRFTYLEKWEKHALVWRMMFYKPKEDWILQAVGWDESVPLLFERDRSAESPAKK